MNNFCQSSLFLECKMFPIPLSEPRILTKGQWCGCLFNFFSQHFVTKSVKYTEKLKEFYSKHQYIHKNCTFNILLSVHLFIYPYLHPSIFCSVCFKAYLILNIIYPKTASAFYPLIWTSGFDSSLKLGPTFRHLFSISS